MVKNGLSFAASLILVMTLIMVGCGKNVEDSGAHVEDSGTHVEENGSTKWPKYACRLTGKEKTSIDEASSIAGWDVPLPVPTYLPEGCEIKEVLAEHGENSRIFIIISDEEIDWSGREFSCVMLLQVGWHPIGFPGLKLVGGPLQDEGDRYALWWHLTAEQGQYEIVLSISKDFPRVELYKVRDNVQVCN